MREDSVFSVDYLDEGHQQRCSDLLVLFGEQADGEVQMLFYVLSADEGLYLRASEVFSTSSVAEKLPAGLLVADASDFQKPLLFMAFSLYQKGRYCAQLAISFELAELVANERTRTVLLSGIKLLQSITEVGVVRGAFDAWALADDGDAE